MAKELAFSQVHVNDHNTAAANVSGGLDIDSKVTFLADDRIKGTMSLITHQSGCLIGSANRSYYKVCRADKCDYEPCPWEIIDIFSKPHDKSYYDIFRGIYSLVDDEGTYFTYFVDEVLSFDVGRPQDRLAMKGRFVIDAEIISIAQHPDGYIMVSTADSVLYFLNSDLTMSLNRLQFGGVVTNALALDGYYLVVVTSTHLVKIDVTDINDVKEIWKVAYRTGDGAIFKGRPSTDGSGTTPTIMTTDSGSKFVLITDGAESENLLAYSMDSGQLVGKASPEPFRNEQNFFTEQSPVTHGNKVLVVQNAPTPFGRRIQAIMESWHIENTIMDHPSRRWRNFSDLFTVAFGDAAHGYYLYELDENEADFEKALSLVWSSDLSCPNSVPTLSIPENRIYCLGRVKCPMRTSNMEASHFQMNPLKRMGFSFRRDSNCLGSPKHFDGGWSLEAVDWNTGKVVKSRGLGPGNKWNSFYAPTELLGEGIIGWGSMGGAVIVESVAMM